MAGMTLKGLHGCLRLLENAAELKRKMPASPSLRPMKEGLFDISKLVGVDNAAFKDPENIAALVGSQRFVIIRGEPSNIDHVARVFDSTRVLLTVLIDPAYFANTQASQGGTIQGGAQQLASKSALSQGSAGPARQPNSESAGIQDSLAPLLAGNTALTCRLFRALFEHILGFAPQGHVLLVSELIGTREHSRAFLSTAIFILGEAIDRENLIPFMMDLGLFGMHIFEYLLQNRDYCGAFYAFRRVERAFIGSLDEEQSRFRNRMDQINARFGGKPCGAKIFEADQYNKLRLDAHLAAADVLEAMALTPWSICLHNAISADPSHTLRSLKIIAEHFERFARAEESKEQANEAVMEHLIAFARQFSAGNRIP